MCTPHDEGNYAQQTCTDKTFQSACKPCYINTTPKNRKGKGTLASVLLYSSGHTSDIKLGLVILEEKII